MDDQQNGEDVLLRLLDDPEVLAAADDSELTQENAVPTGAGTGILSALPPELLGKLPMLMSAIAPMMGGKGEGAVKDSKTALLLALKPYMSPQRCDAIDKLITFARLSDILRQLR